ncbi:MAG: hypothetical protein FDX18_10400 [Chlorobium sp.]|nr:MAG: hypothetical protein FDX18_10400 [Chlorobium sp.]
MKIKRLELKAFGPFSGLFLDFASAIPGLHIVYGPNEAGKSSAMRALQALFFGFPARTGDNFLHPYEQLLVGGCLQGSNGNELTFFRRKRNAKDLFDQNDNLLDASALTPYLHGVEKDLFTALYGINHETLVRGGEGILEQEGDVGKALFAAGAGLASLKPVMDELENEADSLFRPQGSSRAINEALAGYKDLQQQLKLATLSGSEWENHRHALDESLRKLVDAQNRRLKKETEKHRLERLKQVQPDLAERKVLQKKQEELGEVILLPPDFAERRILLQQQARVADSQREQAAARLLLVREKIKGLSLNRGVLDEAEAIEELHQRLGEYKKGKQDLPLREGQRISSRSAAADLLRQIRPDLSITDIESLRPALSKRKTLQSLGSRYEALLQAERNARRQAEETHKTLDYLGGSLQKLSPKAETVGLSRALQSADRTGNLDSEIITLRKDHEKVEQECLAALKRLGLWKGSLEETLQLAVPLQETINRFDDEFRALGDEIQRLQSGKDQLEKEKSEIQEQLHRIEFSADVPSEEELITRRKRRDLGWQLLRMQWIQQEDVEEAGRAYDSEHPLPEAYERMVAISDQTADRLYREAERVQNYAALKAGAERVEKQLEECVEKEERSTALFAGLTNQWLEQWAPSQVNPLSPREMRAWLISFENLRNQVRESSRILLTVEEKELLRRESRKMLLAEIALLGKEKSFSGEELEALVDYACLLLMDMQTVQKERESMETRIRDLGAMLKTAEENCHKSEEELRQWRSEWMSAITPLGIDVATIPSEAIDVIETLQECFEKLKEADDFRKRIEGINRDTKAFEEDVELLARKIAPDLLGIDAYSLVTELNVRLGRATQEKAFLSGLAEEIDTLEKSLTKAETDLKITHQQLDILRQQANCESEDELIEAERRSTISLRVRERLLEVEGNLARIAEGGSFSGLELQSKAIDPDELPGKIETLTHEINNIIDPEIQQLSESIGRIKNDLERMDGSGRAAELAESMQHSMTKIRRLTERYIRLKLAAKILREETERYRSENQDPLLKIASRYFSELTLGSFTGLRTDIDDQGKLVLAGIRPNGVWLQVEAMSSGTRDQLYLALRLATLEWRTESSDTMPFIVDDILVNFDDQRSKATIGALAELGKKNQVILFTHHQKIVETAGEAEFAGKVFIHKLGIGSKLDRNEFNQP